MTVSFEINKLLSLRKVVYLIKLGTESLQSRFKVVLKLIKKFGTVCGYIISYLEKYVEYIAILRAPPLPPCILSKYIFLS
ncbi:MAG: hypothetical protein FD143_3124 [Ignavibacteria bacterium]|nr:MAG: hypothetical protein FD143_3124 [Ignavibacteria bacterium]KAF0158526.1 MAG: hypothetical protein FD188_2526 [Ignavibacteria bacterium]